MRGWVSTAVSSWLNGGLFGSPSVEYTTTGSPTEREYAGFKSLHWTGSGSFVPSVIPAGVTFDIWVVAGGGGGGGTGTNPAAGYSGGGAGGAGGAKAFTSQTLTAASHAVSLGSGGARGSTTGNYGTAGTSGTLSSFAISAGLHRWRFRTEIIW